MYASANLQGVRMLLIDPIPRFKERSSEITRKVTLEMQGVEPKFRSILKGVGSLNLKALVQRYVCISLLRWLEFRGKTQSPTQSPPFTRADPAT